MLSFTFPKAFQWAGFCTPRPDVSLSCLTKSVTDCKRFILQDANCLNEIRYKLLLQTHCILHVLRINVHTETGRPLPSCVKYVISLSQ